MNLYISDLHFGHKGVINFDHRPFENIEEMDNVIIRNWNARVQNDDTVYIIGDLSHKALKEPEYYLRKLKGNKILILGNHDTCIMENDKALHYFHDVQTIMNIKDNDKRM